ncbi:MAG: hypothetical protein NVS9B15_13470 [Acidobacteriaceae bacterium]
MSTPRVHYSVPILHVADMERTVAFYKLLGFTLNHILRDDDGQAFWADMSCHADSVQQPTRENANANLMFARASEPIDPAVQAVLLYLYSHDLRALREHLIAQGITASPIEPRFYMDFGEFRIEDPDRYVILIGP